MKIKKSFLPDIPHHLVDQFGSVNFCSWRRLEEETGIHLTVIETARIWELSATDVAKACGLRASEELIGFTAEVDGLSIHIRYKS